MTYAEWISWFEVQYDLNVTDMCCEASLEMLNSFPELRRIRGHVIGDHPHHGPGVHVHWWCLSPSGDVIDPTASQFSNIIEYVPLKHW